MRSGQIETPKKSATESLSDAEMARIRLDLAVQRHEMLLEKGKRWTLIGKEENENTKK